MYSRRVGDRELTFGVSGKLWHGVLVMFDRESESLWTQLDGRSIRGDRAGEYLEHVDSTFTTWEQWVLEHPDTLVLAKDAEERELASSHYADYFADPDRLIFPHLADGLGGDLGPKDVVFGVVADGAALAVSESALARTNVVCAVVGGRPVAFLRSPATGRAVAVRREHEGRILLLEPLELDDPTELVLDAQSGEAVAVDELEPLRVDRAYWYAWARSHPGGLALTD